MGIQLVRRNLCTSTSTIQRLNPAEYSSTLITMKITVALLALVLIDSAYSWGGRFNRFSPEMLSNLGYGGYGAGYGNNRHAQRFLPASSMDLLESMLQSEEDEDAGDVSKTDTCSGRRCSANEHCCAGSVCVDVDGPSVGTCLPHHGQSEGTECQRNSDCDASLVCAASEAGKTCQQPTETKKLYNEECTGSNECDITKGPCCQKLRRHRQSPRKACSYFRDPMVCLGAVSSLDAIKDKVHYTANEKRLTGRAFNLSHE